MKKDFAFWSLIIMTALFIAGIILIFASLSIGENAGAAAMQANGGFMDTVQYMRIINMTTLSYQLVGTILAVISGIGVLISGYSVYKEMK